MIRETLALGMSLLCALLGSVLAFFRDEKFDAYFPLSHEQAPNFHLLVSAKWVSELITGAQPPTATSNRYTILEVSTSDDSAYAQGHIPGAALIRTDQIEHGPMWNLVPDNQLQATIENLGITHDSTVIVYGDDPSATARVLWTLMYAGVEDVRLLHGGLRSWKRFGGPLETGANHPQRVPFGVDVPVHPEYLATLRDTRSNIDNPSSLLVDVRSRAEFRGKTSGYDYIVARGRIPSSVWGGETADLDGVADVLHLEKRWTRMGLTTTQPLTFYCGTGWRSSLAFFHARLLGFEHIRNFDGSWLEWSATPTA